jgi:hypothetical protein
MQSFINRGRQQPLLPSEGLAWLPLVALGITAGIFPAYGFRPECILVLVFAFFSGIAAIRSLVLRIIHDERPVLSAFALILLTAATLPMFAFSPQEADEEAEPAQTLAIRDEILNRQYFLRIYGTVRTERPLIFIVPPEIGSSASIDLVCKNLEENGFTVVTYFRKDFDTPLIDENGKKHHASVPKLLSYWRTFQNAACLASANEKGKKLEEERRSDITFLLPRIFSLIDEDELLPPVLLAGYGAGGSALAYMAGESGFALRYSSVLGVAAIESRLWSAYQNESPSFPVIPIRAGIITRSWAKVINFFRGLRPRRVELSPSLPRAGLPASGLPVMYAVSGRALDSRQKQNPYRAVLELMQSGGGPAALAALEGAGPLDYQDFPLTHPVYSFLFPGLEGAQKSKTPVNDTAGIIGNYAAMLMEQYGIPVPHPAQGRSAVQGRSAMQGRSTIQGHLHTESKGMPGFRL